MPSGELDLLLIARSADGARRLLRTRTPRAITAAAGWSDELHAQPIGPVLPAGADVVQASGGHAAPNYFVSDRSAGRLWRLGQPGIGTVTRRKWSQIVPGGRATRARRFFASPYNANLLYVVDDDAIRRSDDGGVTWRRDVSLDVFATEFGRFAYEKNESVLQDMIFDRTDPKLRFAIGNAGIFYTADGKTWHRLVSTTAMPGRPVAGTYVSATRFLFVAWLGRGITMIGPIPPN
jgi:hypothetical protein